MNRWARLNLLGAALVVIGIPMALRAVLLMYDTKTTTRVWMLREFGVGLCAAGWGAALALPHRWRSMGMTLVGVGTLGIAIGVIVLSQGMAT